MTQAAYSSACKFCHWYSACVEDLVARDDLTQIPELGRPKREAMLPHLQTVSELANCNPNAFVKRKRTVFSGVGPDTLQRFHLRANLLANKNSKPLLRMPIQLPGHDLELFFDIEVDPMRGICYLHGFVERRSRDNATERFIAFFTPECARYHSYDAVSQLIKYRRSLQAPFD